ncbi:MBL fold metallo-hydrolase [Algihabitans albus]|uniref:MBL fold metallo-hydrolase n=1 Tax=Algihabitans albus TaxID=2164067 RepID=UPI001ABD1768|nr:MBL fold metallo-hydrolase [Algihabitans albus]
MTKASAERIVSRRTAIVGGAALAVAPMLPAMARAQMQDRQIIEIAEGIYRTQNGTHYGLLVDTDDGLIVFDTLNADFSGWLDAEIARRFSKRVAFVIYSHNHADHTSGGEVFAHHDPQYVSHELARESHVRARVATRLADVTFKEGYNLRLGERDIQLRYHGPNDGHGSISLMVPDQGVLSAIDWLVIGRLPFRELNRYDVEGTIRSLYELDTLDWRLASPGHADLGGKDGARILRHYLETLRDATMEQIVDGTPMDQAVAVVRSKLAAVPEFRALKQFDAWVEENIRGVHFQLARFEGFADMVLPNPDYADRQ